MDFYLQINEPKLSMRLGWLHPFQQREQVVFGKGSKLNMPILTRRKPDHFFYFHRRCKAYPVRGYQKDIRRDKMTWLVCRRISGNGLPGPVLLVRR